MKPAISRSKGMLSSFSRTHGFRQLTNRAFAQTDSTFQKACLACGQVKGEPIQKPTKRQASKWRMNKGRAYAHRNSI